MLKMNNHLCEFIRKSRFNVPFGYIHPSVNRFRAFVNIDFNEDGECVYYISGKYYSISNLIAKEKNVPLDSWLDHVFFVGHNGKPVPLSKI